MSNIELSEEVKEKLMEVVKLWADKNLVGRPEILLNAVYFSLEEKLIEKTEEIKIMFQDFSINHNTRAKADHYFPGWNGREFLPG